ncbi:hypothetical protein CLIB1423_01S00408 [[Candida] railenensis]|uniref:DUF3074 domain-containing protein n=1 Tax=[Candida] railenensis TaxID=45579 RepID=A0A9P0QK56_9ASCO|nr:hypothetical protein CLIB1423_01S00408 [[Candida] railenensis]
MATASAFDSSPLSDLEVDPQLVLKDAISVIDSVPSWSPGSTYSYKLKNKQKSAIDVATFSTKLYGNVHWSARNTNLGKTFSADQLQNFKSYFDKYLIGSFDLESASTHTHYEKEYIHEIESIRVEPVSLGTEYIVPKGFECFAYTIQAIYKLQFPLKRRNFFELVLVYKSDTVSYVVSIPIQPKLFKEPNYSDSYAILAKYTSIEKVEYNSDSSIKWTMCTCSSPGGNIPDFVANLSMNKVISRDVPSFLDWAASQEGTNDKN